jgi:hypothetical protein
MKKGLLMRFQLTAGRYRRAAIVLVIAFGLAGTLLIQRAANAAGTQAGSATIVQSDGATPLTSGDASTDFELNLPAQSHCSGDTANQGFNVYGFLAATSVDPGSLTFDTGNGPNNNASAFALVDSSGTPFNAENTAPVTGAVYPGSQPIFNFLAYGGPPSFFPAGTYNIGLECTTSTGAADVFWDTPITITASAAAPGGFTFTTGSTSTTTTTTVAGATTTTLAGGTTTTTVGGGTTTTSSSTTVAEATTTTSSTVASGTTNTSSVVAGAGLATTGSDTALPLYEWGMVLLTLGILALLASRQWGQDGKGW